MSKEKSKEIQKIKEKYVVAGGKAITTLRGILGPGESISIKDIPSKSFKTFIESGYIVKV